MRMRLSDQNPRLLKVFYRGVVMSGAHPRSMKPVIIFLCVLCVLCGETCDLMLRYLAIQYLGVIESVEVEFQPGLQEPVEKSSGLQASGFDKFSRDFSSGSPEPVAWSQFCSHGLNGLTGETGTGEVDAGRSDRTPDGRPRHCRPRAEGRASADLVRKAKSQVSNFDRRFHFELQTSLTS